MRSVVRGFAPLVLCGLAVAGANHGHDALGRVPGILTAEELAAFDLTSADLVVLSACETGLGLRRAGQGVHSLQTALFAAGARSTLTSLWKVSDDATAAFMQAFYRALWRDGATKSAALAAAKRELRARGFPLRDWACWILSGDAR
jgi:CHAT domain-containing protein